MATQRGKGIKMSRLSEERWDVSWTEKFLRFPDSRPGSEGEDRGRKRLYFSLVYEVQVIYTGAI